MLRRPLLLAALVALCAAAAPAAALASGDTVDVVVALEQPGLADAVATSRTLSAAAKRRRLDPGSPASRGHLRLLASAQASAEARIEAAIPGAEVHRRYRIVLNGLSVSLPAGQLDRLARLPGVARVYPSVRYRARLDRSPGLIGAPQLWGAGLSTAGQGVKIAILDDGIDQTHPFFDPRGQPMPEGFPKGQTAFTTAKVIVARAFPPRSPGWRHASRPFDPQWSGHATHVAGIAAGNAGTTAFGRRVDGVAPAAYLGNYKILTIPTAAGLGLNGNSPEIAAGIEAAVADGMDVINLSIGEPEIEPSRDLVVQAIEAATRAGVVVVAAAGNDFQEFGRGSVGSPGSAASAITVAASTGTTGIAPFSSSGPTPVSHRLKPDVTAPGAAILSSVPVDSGTWEYYSGTSMASPHVAGGAALLLQRHPDWTPAQVKSALVLTGRPVGGLAVTRQGGGVITLERAAAPAVFAQPTSLGFGLVRAPSTTALAVELSDAGGGAGEWAVSVEARSGAVPLTVPATVTVPGRLQATAAIPAGAALAEHDGWVVLARGEERLRIPYWVRPTRPGLAGRPDGTLARTGTYRGNTRGKRQRVTAYRYPELPSGGAPALAGPEQVFRVRVTRPVANFGVAVLSRGAGVQVVARVVRAGDENRQVGYTSLPINLNPYTTTFQQPRPVSGAVLPGPGEYDVVFDTPSRARAGAFTFRFWVNDTAPPKARVLAATVRRNAPLRLSLTDAGSGVDPASVRAWVDAAPRPVTVRAGRAAVDLRGLAPGRHRLELQASDFQESRNMENVYRILPNTVRLTAAFTIR